jgi:hypothetical protein
LSLPFAFTFQKAMTPEELNQTIEFIIQSQARLAAAQEQDREDRVKLKDWSKGLFMRIAQLIEHQSRRMDWYDEFMRETKKLHKDSLARLDRILDKLSDKPN